MTLTTYAWPNSLPMVYFWTGGWYLIINTCINTYNYDKPKRRWDFGDLDYIFSSREYTRRRRERLNCLSPADIAFFSLESDKNVALIFQKVRYFNIHFNVHTCHQLKFDLGWSSTLYPSGLHKKIGMSQRTSLGRQLMSSREKIDRFAVGMR